MRPKPPINVELQPFVRGETTHQRYYRRDGEKELAYVYLDDADAFVEHHAAIGAGKVIVLAHDQTPDSYARAMAELAALEE